MPIAVYIAGLNAIPDTVSTTLRPVAVDLVLDRLPQAVHHALKTVKADLVGLAGGGAS